MRRIAFWLVGFSQLGLIIPPTAFAGQCRPFNHTCAVVQQTVVAAVVPVIAIPVVIPVTAFQYLPAMQATQVSGPVQAAKPDDIDRLVRERVDAVLRERAANDGPPTLILPGEPVAAPQPTKDAAQQAVTLLAQKCASCHTQGVKTAGNTTLFTKVGDGSSLQFTPSTSLLNIYQQIDSANMPFVAKGNKNSPEAIKGDELALLRDYLTKTTLK